MDVVVRSAMRSDVDYVVKTTVGLVVRSALIVSTIS